MRKFLTQLCVASTLVIMCVGVVGAQQEQVFERYSVSESPYIYDALSADNTSSFTDLSNEKDYFDDGGSNLFGYDDGVILLGNFGGQDPAEQKFLPAPTNFMSELFTTVGILNTNGSFLFPRAVEGSAGGNVTIDPVWSPLGSGFYTNSTVWSRVFAFGGDLDMRDDEALLLMGARGVAPNRLIILEWRNALIVGTTTRVTFQIILQETSATPEIDIVFGPIDGSVPNSIFYTGINHGTAASPDDNVIGKDFDGDEGNYIASRWVGGEWESSSDVDSPYGTRGAWPTKNIRYCLAPYLGAEALEATIFDADANPDDVVNLGDAVVKKYRISNPSASDDAVKITMRVIGPDAASYSVFPSSVVAVNPGTSQLFDIIFEPKGFGYQNAEVEIVISTTDAAECPFVKEPVYLELRGRVPGLAALDPPAMIDFGEVGVQSNTLRSEALFYNESQVDIRYYFSGPIPNDTEFSIDGATGTPPTLSGIVSPGETVELPARFQPTEQGRQQANVDLWYESVDGAIQAANQQIALFGDATPTRIQVRLGDDLNHSGTGSVIARNGESSVGETPNYRNFFVKNTGASAVISVENFIFYNLNMDDKVDGRIRVRWTQGFGLGEALLSRDFFVERQQAGTWIRVEDDDRVTLTAGEELPMRVVFAPHRPGIKFVRMFFNTDATVDQNFSPIETFDPGDNVTPQLMSYDLYGFRARNSLLQQLSSVEFKPTEVGEERVGAYLEVQNVGDSRLLIEDVMMLPGDEDFKVDQVFPNSERLENGKYVIPVDGKDSIWLSFNPLRAGTRFSTLFLHSNDSTETGDELVGKRFIQVFGLATANAQMSVATDGLPLFESLSAIVDVPSTYQTADITVQHDGGPQLNITELEIAGPDAADFRVVSTDNLGPVDINDSRTITVQFAPQSRGQNKTAELIVRSNAAGGERVLDMVGIADVRLVGPADGTLFTDVRISTTESASEVVTITNDGTVDLEISSLSFSSADYSSGFSGATVPVGASVDITVDFSSSAAGDKSGTMTVNNNSTNDPALEIPLAGFIGLRQPSAEANVAVRTDIVNGVFLEKEVCIEVTNTGDLPLTLDAALTAISGPGADQYELGTVPTDPIDPGATVEICFIYKPTGEAANAVLSIVSNGDPSPLDVNINGTVTDVDDEPVAGLSFALEQNTPNPVRDKSLIRFMLPSRATVSLEIFDVRGERVAVLVDGEVLPAGQHEVTVDGASLLSGTYVYKLTSGEHSAMQTMQIVK